MAISSLLAFDFRLALHPSHLVARGTWAREQAERGSEDVVGDRLEGDVVAVVDESYATHAPPAPDIGRERDLPARRDLHGRHVFHHIKRT
jgi:hypothetical protein